MFARSLMREVALALVTAPASMRTTASAVDIVLVILLPKRFGRTKAPCESRANPAGVRRTTSGTFSLNEGGDARSTGGPNGLRTVGGIDALIALQGVEDPTQRRKHAVKRGRVALDALDELKIGLLGGDLAPATL